jgi:hypothetical protein
MNTQPEALRLAEFIDERWILCGEDADIVSAELRRLHEVNQELVEALENLVGVVWRVHGEDGVIRITKAEAALAKARGME